MITFLALALLPALAGGGAFAPSDDPALPKGTLVVDGGGKPSIHVQKRALEIAGGPAAKIVILPQASNLPEAGAKAAKRWHDAGATDVTVLKLDDHKVAAAAIRGAKVVWIGGGDQERLMERLAGTGVPEAILEMYREGGVVGGASAGAAVMSDVMISRGIDEYPLPLCDYVLMGRGLGLWPGVIVDQHFLKLHRLTRLKRALGDYPGLVGVGIDESTAAFVRGRKIEVVGESTVTIIDPRGSRETKVPVQAIALTNERAAEPAGPKAEAPGEPKVLSVEPGMTFDLDRGIISDPIAEAP